MRVLQGHSGAARDPRGPRLPHGHRGRHAVQAVADRRSGPVRRVPLPAGLLEPGRAARHALHLHPDARALCAEQHRSRALRLTSGESAHEYSTSSVLVLRVQLLRSEL